MTLKPRLTLGVADFARALSVGATKVKQPGQVFWGGCFAGPDGRLWEAAHNPFFPFDADGRIKLQK